MAQLIIKTKATVELSVTQSQNNSLPVNPDKYTVEFDCQKRRENDVITLPPGQSVTLDLGALGYTSTDLVRIQNMTQNKPFLLSFDAQTTKVPIVPVTTDGYAFIIGSASLNKINLENPDSQLPINIAVSFFQKAN
jgi:hypothetical protein